ncbi:MucBP domain-containing protein [Candidatus Saccharibacteria bacterium]|nr:MucBP domain-containing protein [Candidatus Saccharibacteria bacterium]
MRISIRNARRAFLDFRNAKFKKLTVLVAILAVTTLGGYGALKHFANAQNGNFADNVKTFMEMIAKKEDKSEKTEFYSGEEIVMNSRVEVSSEGSAKSYDNAYFLIKIPKKYLNGEPKVTATSAITSSSVTPDNDYYIYRGNYTNLQAGSINSINYIFKFKDIETPENYKPEITHELYDKDGTLLSKQSKTLNTLKYPSWISAELSLGQVYAARYTNKENTDIETLYFDNKNIPIISNFYTNTGVENGGNKSLSIGRKQVESIIYKITLPEYISPSPESIKSGWNFDENTRIATLKRTDGGFGFNNFPKKIFETRYATNTPLSVLNKEAKIKFDTTVNYTDGTSLDASTEKTFTPEILSYPKGGLVGIRKFSSRGGLGYRNKPKKREDGSIVSTAVMDISNIDYNKNRNYNWFIGVHVLNDGQNKRHSIKYIRDSLDNNDQYIDKISLSSYTSGYSIFEDLKIPKLDVYAIDSNNVETKVGEMTRDNVNIRLPYGTKEFRIEFPDGTTLPSDTSRVGLESSFYFTVYTKFFDIDKVRDSIKPDQDYETRNSAFLKIENNPEKESKDIAFFEKQQKKVNNNLESNSQPITTIGSHFLFKRVSRSEDTVIKKPTYALLFSNDLGLGDEAQKCIDSGDCSLTENYKNSGKKLLRITGKDSLTDSEFEKFVSNSIKVLESTPNNQYTVDFITMWDANDKFRYGDGNDDLDFGEDGNTNSTNIARSSTTFNVLKPEQVAIKKYVRKHNKGNFENSVSKLDPADLIDYRISVINISDRPLLTSRTLEVLPTANDKKIVENNQGVQEDRGSQIPIKLTGAIAEKEGFKISYSTDEPGSNQNESWNKNFVDKTAITDWSKVRMVKIEQKTNYSVPAQTVVNIDFTAQIDPKAADNTIANNSVAVTISASGNLVESDPVEAKVEYPTTIEGIAFEDNNKNNVFDENIDTLLPDYTVELFKNTDSTPVQSAKTDSKGHYSFKTKDFANYHVRFTRKEALETVKKSYATINADNNKASHVDGNSTNATVRSSSFTNNPQSKHFFVNIGVFRPRGSVEAKFVNQNGDEIEAKKVIKENALINENYTATKPAEITKDSLVYVFEKLKDGSDPENGTVKEKTQTVIFQYKPKEGGKVEAKFIKTGTNQEISPAEIVKPAGTQVGSEYSATSKPEINQNGLKYVYNKISANSAPENGRVKAGSQTVIFEYSPKAGKGVNAISKIIGSNKTIKTETVSPDGTQVGTPYSSTPQPEITHEGITYVFSSLIENSAAQNGKVSEQEQTIIYGYVAKKGGQVLAQYVDQNGKTIKNTKVVKATDTPVGTEYSDEPDLEITSDTGLVYTFEKIKSGSKTGRVEARTKEVVYQYTPKLGKGVIARLLNSKDNSVLEKTRVEEDGKQIGTTFSYNPPKEVTDKKGLVYTLEDKSKAVSGKISSDSQSFDFHYKPKEGGRVEAKFIDQTGKELKGTAEILKAKTQVGTPYFSKAPKEITKDGLSYVFEKIAKDSAPESGKAKDIDQTVTYIYAPKKGGTVIERFLDQKGNPIQNENILHKIGTQVGTPFESVGTNRIEINGRIYQLKRIEGTQKGFVVENETIISYIFEDITKIAAPNTGFARNVSSIIVLISGATLTFLTAKNFKTRKN